MSDLKPNPAFKEKVNPHMEVFRRAGFVNLSAKDKVLTVERTILEDPNFFGFDTYALKHASPILLDARENFTKWKLTIGSELCNKGGNLHGGAAATILDNLTSTALVTIAREGFLDGGHVSRTITMTYLRPVPLGEEVTVENEVMAAGRNTANVVGKIFNREGKLCVTCVHDKAVFSTGKRAAAKL
jgi:acyl-coenzyme A thioesterase 13